MNYYNEIKNELINNEYIRKLKITQKIEMNLQHIIM